MLYYDRIEVFEGLNINQTSASKECNTCHNWCFINKGLKFHLYVCNNCHDVLMITLTILILLT